MNRDKTAEDLRAVIQALVEAAKNALTEHEARFGECNCGICMRLRDAVDQTRGDQ